VTIFQIIPAGVLAAALVSQATGERGQSKISYHWWRYRCCWPKAGGGKNKAIQNLQHQ
jgi:hypothetical protein